MKGIFIVYFFLMSLFVGNSLEAYQRLNKNTKAYYYTQPRPYWNKSRPWNRTAYKSYFYYGHDVYPQYTYVYPGHSYFYAYPKYFNNDQGSVYFYWGY